MNSVIKVNPIACEAYGYCAELLPELVSLDEWGYPIVDGRPVPPTSSSWHGAPRRIVPVAPSFSSRPPTADSPTGAGWSR